MSTPLSIETLRRKSCWLFDLDGTLVDSESLHAEAFRRTLAKSHPALVGSFDYAPLKGLSTKAAAARLGIGELETPQFIIDKRGAYLNLLACRETIVVPGAKDLLKRLRQQKRRLFVVTGAGRSSAQAALEKDQLHGTFEGIIVAEDVKRSKPDPEPFRLCLERYRLVAEDTVAIEDSEAGLASARGAGLHVVGIGNDAAGADFRFSTLRELAAALIVSRPS